MSYSYPVWMWTVLTMLVPVSGFWRPSMRDVTLAWASFMTPSS